MPEINAQALSDVFCDVLERLAFLFGDEADRNDLPGEVTACVEASIEYSGPENGRLILLAPAEVACELAANLLGVEPDEDSAEDFAHDALGELMNVTVGQLLTAVAGDEPVFDLSPPQVREASSQQWVQMLNDEHTVTFVVEGNPVLLYLVSTD